MCLNLKKMPTLTTSTTLSEIWQKAKSELELVLPREAFDEWFSNLACVGGDESKIVLGSPSAFAPYWITDNYLDILSQNLSMAAGHNISVEITVVNSPEPAAAETPAPRMARAVVAEEPKTLLSINPRNTFESFVVGESNQLAHAAALAVAQSVGKAFNPLFLYGDTGLGKTHLMHAIAHFIIKNNPSAKVVYISSEAFVNDYIKALGDGNIASFRKRYRNTDVLLIDDIQFFAKKESSQNEFFHTFNDLFNANKQIVLSCDKPLNEVEDIEKRLVSRFAWGMCVDIKMPDYETRLAILRRKVASLGDSANIGDDVLDLIARRFTKNVRRMEGALNKLIGYSSLINSNEPVSLEKAAYLLADDFVQEKGAAVDVELIQKKVAEHYHLEVSDIVGKRRTSMISMARQTAMYISRKLTTHTLQEIGKRFGGRDHGTVIHAMRTVETLLEQDEKVKRTVAFLMKSLSD